jgi:protein-S-isoprenylcysteine O-methyltransferase Ste14
MLEKFGENNATKLYDMICGLMFFNIGLGITATALHADAAIPMPPALRWSLFVLLTVAGFGIKFWATWIVGINTYYFRDLFLEKSHGEYTARGPYRRLANPMYGVGNFHAYGPALIMNSLTGLSFALACHIGIYAFYFIVEKPFIRRTYQTD